MFSVSDKIDNYLRNKYYKSINKETPVNYIVKEIVNEIRYSKQNYPKLYHISRFFENIEYRIHRIGEMLSYPKIYIINTYINQTHVLKSTLKKGEYHDVGDVISDALFNAARKHLSAAPANSYTYADYKSDPTLAEYTEWQIKAWENCAEAVNWYDVTRIGYENEIEKLYNEKEDLKPSDVDVDDNNLACWLSLSREIYTRIIDIETKSRSERIEMLKKIIEVHDCFWT